MNILMLGPWLPTVRRQLTTERLHRFARELAREHRLTLASTSMIPYALELAPRVPVVLDFGDVDSEWWRDRARQFSGFKTKIYRAEAMRLREVEIMGARRATHCLVATPQAARTVASFAPW